MGTENEIKESKEMKYIISNLKDFEKFYEEINKKLKLKIVTEKRQSVEKGLRFSVELENVSAESLSFGVSILKDFPHDRYPKEKNLPFDFSVLDGTRKKIVPMRDALGFDGYIENDLAKSYYSNTLGFDGYIENDLAKSYYSNRYRNAYTSPPIPYITRNITIKGDSAMELDSVIFSEYQTRADVNNMENSGVIEKKIVSGTYTINARLQCIFIVDDATINKRYVEIFTEPVVVILE